MRSDCVESCKLRLKSGSRNTTQPGCKATAPARGVALNSNDDCYSPGCKPYRHDTSGILAASSLLVVRIIHLILCQRLRNDWHSSASNTDIEIPSNRSLEQIIRRWDYLSRVPIFPILRHCVFTPSGPLIPHARALAFPIGAEGFGSN